MFAFLLLIGLCFYGAHHYRARLAGLKTAEELHGEVVSWNQYSGWRGQPGWKYYELIVNAENGRTYKIVTENKKARKYRSRTDIVILVPYGADPAAYAETGLPRPDSIIRPLDEIGSALNAPLPVSPVYLVPSPTAVTIKEAAEKPWNYWFLLISGIVFSLFFVVCVIGMIVDYFC